MSRLRYFVRETLISLRRNVMMTIAGIMTVFISLMLFGGILVVVRAVDHGTATWRHNVEVKLAAGKKLIPGVISHATNVVEHPELVADRLVQYANAAGRDNVIGGVDCGFGTFAGRVQVDTKIVWMKLAALAEGARLASRQLW